MIKEVCVTEDTEIAIKLVMPRHNFNAAVHLIVSLSHGNVTGSWTALMVQTSSTAPYQIVAGEISLVKMCLDCPVPEEILVLAHNGYVMEKKIVQMGRMRMKYCVKVEDVSLIDIDAITAVVFYGLVCAMMYLIVLITQMNQLLHANIPMHVISKMTSREIRKTATTQVQKGMKEEDSVAATESVLTENICAMASTIVVIVQTN